MDIEQLSKSQVLMLTLLVTFVTSIATGIVTVSLMEKAPPVVAQTVNRVVEHTVEKIVQSSQSAAVASQEKKTVKDPTLADVVAAFEPSVVRLYSSDASNPTFLGLGVVIGKEGGIVTDSGVLVESGDAVALLQNGSRVRVFVRLRDTPNGLAFLRSATSTESGALVQWMPAYIGNTQTVLGQRVIAISGEASSRLADGIVTALSQNSASAQVIDTSISEHSLLRGSALIALDGTLVGLNTSASREVSGSGFISSSALSSKDVSATN